MVLFVDYTIQELFRRICKAKFQVQVIHVADAGYGSEANYSYVIDELEKTALIPYGMFQKEQSRQYKKSEDNPSNWSYDEENDRWTKPDWVVYSFKYYSRRKERYGFEKDFKIYEADPIQVTKELEVLARTETNRLKQIHWNPTWNYFKEQAKQALHSEDGARIYAKRKIDVETVFGRMKGIFGVRRVHVRGRRKVQTEIGFLFMSMNLTKLAKIWVKKAQQNKKNTRKNSFLIEFEVTFVWYLLFRASFCPASFRRYHPKHSTWLFGIAIRYLFKRV